MTGALALGALATYPSREAIYTTVVQRVGSTDLQPVIAAIADKGLLALVALTAAVAGWSFFRSRPKFWTLVCAGIGVIVSYALSEGIKILVAQPRPCAQTQLATTLACPSPGDWSWPSNHSVLAAAFATSCILVAGRTRWFAVPTALVIAISRVAAGVHYAHDVLTGLALGLVVVVLAVPLLRPRVDRLLSSGRRFVVSAPR